jgi:serine/threonine-protein kinase
MADPRLLGAAGRIADGEAIDWAALTSTLDSDDERGLADELAVVQQIIAGHRPLHQLLPAAADTPSHLVPDRARWGHLDLLNVVGRGSYGMVYRAWDTRLERVVALKLFHGASDPEKVIQEGRMLARVRHENVVTIYGADVIDGVAGIWMELVHGKTLDKIAKTSGPLPAREVAAIAADVARALGAVHAAGLLHCDVKTQNVVREVSGRVVLMDLGAGRLAPEARDDSVHVSDIAGTPRYMAPELFLRGASATKATDIYSFGVLIYHLVSGQFPVEGKTLGEMKRAHAAGEMRPLASLMPHLPQSLVDVVTRALDRTPAQRPSSANDMQLTLSAIALEPEPERVPVRRVPVAWWIGGAAVAGVLATVVLRPLFTPAAVANVPVQSIAVMPIRNLTGDPSKQYLADGLTEVLTAHLARLPGLNVVSSATMMSAGAAGGGDKAVADKLGVQLLLAGAVLQADDRISLSVKLTDPRAGREVWGAALDRTADNILGARSEIAVLLAARLSLSQAPSQTEGEQPGAEAQDAYLRALAELHAGPNATKARAVALLTRAVSLEPAWADPIADLAFAQQTTIEFGNPAQRSQAAEVVRTNALKAMQLDPALSMAYTALAAVQAYHDWDFAAAEATLGQAIAADPRDGTARGRLAFLFAARGRLDDAISHAQAARDQEPLVADRHGVLGMVHYYARDWRAATADFDRALALAPQLGIAHLGKGLALGASGKPAEAVASIQRALAIAEHPGWVAALGVTCARVEDAGCVADALRRLRRLEAGGAFVSLDNYAYISGYQHQLDEAFRLLNEAVDRKMTNVLWLAVDPRADALRGDTRFDGVIARMGLVSR